VLSQKLERLGARVLTRITRGVTHIVIHQPPSIPKEVDDAEVTDLYERAAKVTRLLTWEQKLRARSCSPLHGVILTHF
jgi:hypothetical protein